MKKALALAFIVGLVVTPKAMAELKKGDDAPKIFIKEWVKGGSFDLATAKPKDVVVVEFWATWCGPCRTSIPHMSDMQDHFKAKGVTFIGVTDEPKATVNKFLKDGGWDEKMRYRVAIDDSDKTSNAWMKAAKMQGIPTAFVVQGGKLKWIGHPMDGLGLIVANLVGDEEYAKKEEAEQKKREKFQEIMQRFQMAAVGEDWEKAVSIIDEALKFDDSHFGLKMTKYHLLVTKIKKPVEAGSFGQEMLGSTTDAANLNAFAWTILTDEEFEGARDLELAKMAAEKALKASDEKDPSIIDTYARALADNGDLTAAIEWQNKAIELADGPLKAELRKSLKELKARKDK